ncbi:MAG: hypothetical protein QXJ74_05210 [Nitrososphaera sp.]
MVLAGLAIGGAYLFLRSRQTASADVGSSTPSPDNVEPLTVLLPPGQGGSTGGSSAPPQPCIDCGGQGDITKTTDPNAAPAQVTEVNTGFQPVSGQPIPTIPLNFLTTQVNPVTGQEQAVFQRIDDKGVPAAAGFKLPGGGVAFIEQLPQGAASTAPNVVYLSPKASAAAAGPGHQATNAFSSKPGDANYDASVAKTGAAYQANPTAETARAYVQAIKTARSTPAPAPKPSTSTAQNMLAKFRAAVLGSKR